MLVLESKKGFQDLLVLRNVFMMLRELHQNYRNKNDKNP